MQMYDKALTMGSAKAKEELRRHAHQTTVIQADMAAEYFADSETEEWTKEDSMSRALTLDEFGGWNPIDPTEIKSNAKALDPATEAKGFLESGKEDGVYRLRYHRDTFHWWSHGRYTDLRPSEVRGRLVCHLNQFCHHLTTNITSNVIDQIKAQSLLSFGHQPPCWLEPVPGCEAWEPTDLLVAKNGNIHLPTQQIAPATPRFFTPVALDFAFDPDAPEPAGWLAFLNQIWPDDPDSILTLQQWFGLCLTPDTRFQKMLLVVGPRRSGKGTINRILRAVVGEQNCAGPTLASLGQNFGLQPLLGKTLATVSDARLSGRSDQAFITERLLSITGEDALTVDRKHLEPITAKLLTRIMVLTNELPRLGDSSGALSGRMIVLRMIRSFYGEEDRLLTDKLLAERAGILRWAIAGWHSLRDQGYFVQPESGDCLREQLDELGSPVAAFLADRCVVGEGNRVGCQSLYQAWSAWSVVKGMKVTNDATFGRDLSAVLPAVSRIRPRESGERQWVYEGVGLLPVEFRS